MCSGQPILDSAAHMFQTALRIPFLLIALPLGNLQVCHCEESEGSGCDSGTCLLSLSY